MYKYGITKAQQYLIDSGILLAHPVQKKEDIEKYKELVKQNLPLSDDICCYADNCNNFFKLIRIITEDETNDVLLSMIASTLKNQRNEFQKQRNELREQMQEQQNDITTIKNCVMFFTVIAIISLVATIFISCSGL